MNDKQIEIGNRIIEALNNKPGHRMSQRELISYCTHRTDLIVPEVVNVLSLLIDDYGLIRRKGTNGALELTRIGEEACKKGLSNCLKKINKQEYWNSPLWSLRISIIAISVSLFLGLLNYCSNRNTAKDIKKFYTKEQVDSLLNVKPN